MKKANKTKSAEQLINRYPVVEEGGEVLPCPRDGTSEVAITSWTMSYIEKAQQGDAAAWGHLYADVASYVKAGLALPKPLREILTQRMVALSKALVTPDKNDIRAGVLNAVAPMPDKKVRLVGAKKKTMTVDAVAVDVLKYAEKGVYTEKGMSLKAAARKVSAILASINGRALYSAESLEAAAKRVRKQLREAQEKNNGGE